MTSPVIWHLLHANQPELTAATYRELFGWKLTEKLDLGTAGSFQQFCYGEGLPNCGSITDVAGRAGVHPQWLLHFGIEALDSAMSLVRREGGEVLGPFELPSGDRVAVCDDPQGAAFALYFRSEVAS